jgi:hypothetical protein
MHLGAKAEFSTFRRTLAAGLASPLHLRNEDDPGLTNWITAHLSVICQPFSDPDVLAALEHAVARRLDPPFNLAGMAPTAVRTRLQNLRATRPRTG